MKIQPFSLTEQISEISPQLEMAVLRVLRSGNYIGGKEVDSFEKTFANYIGVSSAIGCNSGTDALVLALRALDIGIGDEVITPSFTFFATAEAISNVGAKPVFVDVDPSTYLIDLKEVEKAITPATKVILPVHLFGAAVDMHKLMALAKKFNLRVVEDCAQAVGTFWKDNRVGSFGDIGCFSFFPTKNLGAAGDAGLVTTNDLTLAQSMRELAVHGMPKRYFHTKLGYNSRLDTLQAAVLNVKIPKLNDWIKRRNKIAIKYMESLSGIAGIELPSGDFPEQNSWNQFVIRVKKLPLENKPSELINYRDIFKSKLEYEGVKTIIYYPIPIHLQPAYKGLGYEIGDLPNTEELCNEVLSLPIFPELSDDQFQYIISKIKKILLK